MSVVPLQDKKASRAYRVMVVDDSAIIRGLISRWLEEDPEITVVATAANGVMAVRNLVPSGAEVVILDVEMPQMDGMTALPKLLEAAPNVKVIMASTLTRRNAEISLEALEHGAADYIPKPESSREVNASQDFRIQVLEKVKALGAVARKDNKTAGPATVKRPVMAQAANDARSSRQPLIELRKPSLVAPRVLVVGSSTGGPQALLTLIGALSGKLTVPLLITQHMPATFTAILADHLARASGIAGGEAKDNEPLVPGRFYLARGDHHMTVADDAGQAVVRLNRQPLENYCRPAVDQLFRTAADLFGAATLGVMLTGMGSDGLKGSRKIAQAGGTIIAQDEATSIVWGMPGAVTNAGLASAVLPISELSETAVRLMKGERL